MSRAVFEILAVVCFVMSWAASMLVESPIPVLLGFSAGFVLINLPGEKA